MGNQTQCMSGIAKLNPCPQGSNIDHLLRNRVIAIPDKTFHRISIPAPAFPLSRRFGSAADWILSLNLDIQWFTPPYTTMNTSSLNGGPRSIDSPRRYRFAPPPRARG
jgi:hypothetical protein